MTVNRRDFLIRGSAAVAAVGAGTLVSGLPTAAGAAGASATSDPSPEQETALPTGDTAVPLVARIRDVRTGEMDLFLGEHEVTCRDPQLVARLFRAAQ
jgi:Ubiquitinol-cytochrome C reductase Fe-S subunit TAT signal